MNIEFKEFIDEVKDEIMCYEELGQEYALKWEKEFYQWAEDNLGKNKNIKELRLENQGSRHQSDDARLPFYINIQDVYMKKGKFP